MTTARQWSITGKVQGVGFRPFVYRLAHELQVNGWVRNSLGQVDIHGEGSPEALQRFAEDLVRRAPAIAEPRVQATVETAVRRYPDFRILASEAGSIPRIHIPADFFTCDDCLHEMHSPHERRHDYPFINCTQCGPRYTIIRCLPYDRPNTSMAEFPLCEDCRREYEDPLDRRFHAQPLACPVCGPALHFHDEDQLNHYAGAALDACVAAIETGLIVALKGVGGYHLVCDANRPSAVGRLRRLKPRPDKPLALMLPMRGEDQLDAVRQLATVETDQAELLRSPGRPIVLLESRPAMVPDGIAPGLREVGVMLPYSPLHHLLLARLDRPLVATSANISGEPVLTDNGEVEQRLGHVADACLHHNREIVRPADDPLYRRIGGMLRPLRMGRGNAPLELELPECLAQPTLACGSHMKNTVALAWDSRLVVSPHIGDLDSRRSQAVYQQVVADLQALYQVQAERVVCDAHPGYASTRWAQNSGLPLVSIQHHHAHASALAYEYWNDDDWLVFTWDGVGYGADGTLWGGEALLGRPGTWQRVASMLPFYLPGGEKAGREPWRSAAALCWQAGVAWNDLPGDSELLRQAWQKRLNCPQSSAVGRLFDAAAALTALHQRSTFEGQGPMLLEHACNGRAADHPALPQIESGNGLLQADWRDLLPMLLDKEIDVGERAARFHGCLANTLLAQATLLRKRHGIRQVGLCGGVFQNRVLADFAMQQLEAAGFAVYLPLKLPANDAAISTGQVIEALAADHQ